jgi:hypothetical protein
VPATLYTWLTYLPPLFREFTTRLCCRFHLPTVGNRSCLASTWRPSRRLQFGLFLRCIPRQGIWGSVIDEVASVQVYFRVHWFSAVNNSYCACTLFLAQAIRVIWPELTAALHLLCTASLHYSSQWSLIIRLIISFDERELQSLGEAQFPSLLFPQAHSSSSSYLPKWAPVTTLYQALAVLTRATDVS